ncbi:MAG: helix-turn-helix transcriptional regulator [Bacteroidetes bacterium]|uniref:Helix-turn-helix transcriptional regulator n=1 Tax=Candidatus Enterocola intestinipullorum TaxID=2840783 RepID=A0A9D9HDJ7_9BACT|nr:helix-turn-helix transcriptional regulator [Candidatus Enterocola intestinipullorum]
MKLYTHEQILEETLGKKGTPRRDEYEEAIDAYILGETIKRARVAKKMTQEQLGDLMGVKKSQVSRIENGKNLTFATIARAFKAMKIPVSLDMGNMGKIPLWQ